MDSSEKFNNLMEREISRGEFLRYVGVALVGMLGITTFLRNLHHNVPNRSLAPSSGSMMSPRSHGYGSSPYGR